MFYEYESFEQMLCDSSLFKMAATASLLEPFSFLTLERYYEALLSEITADTEFKYEHGKLLPKAYAGHWPELLDSDTGKPLLDFIRTQSLDNGTSIGFAIEEITAF